MYRMATVSEIFYFTYVICILYENCDIASAMSSTISNSKPPCLL